MILVLPLHLTNYHSGLFLPGNIFTQFAHCDETLITQKVNHPYFCRPNCCIEYGCMDKGKTAKSGRLVSDIFSTIATRVSLRYMQVLPSRLGDLPDPLEPLSWSLPLSAINRSSQCCCCYCLSRTEQGDDTHQSFWPLPYGYFENDARSLYLPRGIHTCTCMLQ